MSGVRLRWVSKEVRVVERTTHTNTEEWLNPATSIQQADSVCSYSLSLPGLPYQNNSLDRILALLRGSLVRIPAITVEAGSSCRCRRIYMLKTRPFHSTRRHRTMPAPLECNYYFRNVKNKSASALQKACRVAQLGIYSTLGYLKHTKPKDY